MYLPVVKKYLIKVLILWGNTKMLQYKREPLEENEISDLRKGCKGFEEELAINVLLETGMRVSELANLTEDKISWQ